MSRIGKKPVPIVSGVKVAVQDHLVRVEGPKGKLELRVHPVITVKLDDAKKELVVTRPDDEKQSKALHGLTRSLLANMIQGASQGYRKSLEIQGVGYKAELRGKEIHMALGFSHPVVFPLPEGITAEYDAKANRLTVKGADKHLVGLTAAQIRKVRPPEPYKGKGIKYVEETIRRKQGKTGAT